MKTIVAELQNDLAARDATIEELKDEMRAKEGAYEESQGLLAATKEELRVAVESLQAPIRITSQEEGKQMIRSGLHAVKSLELVKKQFQE